jgi:hypothetical protein
VTHLDDLISGTGTPTDFQLLLAIGNATPTGFYGLFYALTRIKSDVGRKKEKRISRATIPLIM